MSRVTTFSIFALFCAIVGTARANPADILITIDKVTEEKLILYKVPAIQVQYTVKNLGETGYCFDEGLLSRENNSYGKYKPIIRGTSREGEELTYPQFGTIAPNRTALRIAPGETFTSFTNVEALLPGFAASNSASFIKTLQIKLYGQPCQDSLIELSGYNFLSERQGDPLQAPDFLAQSTEYQVISEIDAPAQPEGSAEELDENEPAPLDNDETSQTPQDQVDETNTDANSPSESQPDPNQPGENVTRDSDQ